MDTSTDRFDVAVVGAGILGLATALILSRRRPELRLIVLEKEDAVARHQTGHNSGVIHRGLYYKPGSLKARLCRAGADALTAFCDENDVGYELCGKVVVATDASELPALDTLYERSVANGVRGIERIGPERLAEIEPHARGVAALLSPGTGIVDYGAVARAYAARIEEAGHTVLRSAGLRGVKRTGDDLVLTTAKGAVGAGHVVNCAGLHSDRVARLAGLDPDVRIIPFRGEYHTLAPEREHLVAGLIYPVPDPRFPFLGVHFTRMFGGGVECGPNAVLAWAREGYRQTSFRPRDTGQILGWPGFWRMAGRYWRVGTAEVFRSFSKELFASALRKLVPEVRKEDLTRGGAGVRAQAVHRTGALLDDFAFAESHRAVHVLNAPSPGATASLAIAEHIVDRCQDVFGWSD